MASKIYLSPALHGWDNPTKCPVTCSENTHCGRYMDIVEKRLKQLGFSVKRGGNATGDEGMYARVSESNAWGADLHYVAHTNAGGGHYSMTMLWDNVASEKYAEILHKHRKNLAPDNFHKNVVRKDLYEIRATTAPCLYDELFFHDSATDCKWFHNGGMELMAEDTVKAICEMFGVQYKQEEKPKAESKIIYRVQVGAFAVRENAENYVEKLKADGYDAFIVEAERKDV